MAKETTIRNHLRKALSVAVATQQKITYTLVTISGLDTSDNGRPSVQ